MGADVTVITPTLPERHERLALMVADIYDQTVAPAEHRIGIDYAHRGPAVVRNRLIEGVSSKWLAFCDDDDRFAPEHLQTLTDHSAGADVVYTLCHVTGERYGWEPAHRCAPARGEIPVTVLMRTEAFRAAGGFPVDETNEDEGLFLRLMAAGATFTCVHTRTWTYQFHQTNRSRAHLHAAR